MNFPPIDVIIPVYRSLDETRACLESIWAYPQSCQMNLIVINDCSPEPELVIYLNTIALEKEMILLHNEENLGFVGTVNRGMALNPTHDVLLLNSDTEVTNNWLEKIQKAAYATDKVGSVTPFSNNATICSYPRFCEDNPLPTGWTLAEIDQLCAQVNAGKTVEVPTGVGFCMYIRRDCLNEVGLFDVAHFGKGYGEENDFCMRASYQGWKNLFLLDTFVHHKGGVSFGDSQNPRKQKAMEVLRELHPQYDMLVLKHIQKDPARSARFALDMARLQTRPTILFVNHNRGGGTLRHVHEFDRPEFAAKFNLVMLSSGRNGQAEISFLSQYDTLKIYFKIARDYEVFIDFLKKIHVKRIHYHHTLDHHPLIWTLGEIVGCAFDVTLHDYYFICPQISLTNEKGQYCLEKGEKDCEICLKKNMAPQNITIQKWRQEGHHFLQKAERIFCPSRDVHGRMTRYFPDLAKKLHFVYHLDYFDFEKEISRVIPSRLAEKNVLKIVVLGALSPIKGADILEATALLAKKMQAPVEFHLLGYGYRHLVQSPKAALIVHGPYEEAFLAEKINAIQPHLVWFPALWPETYSYTLSASFALHLPVVCTNLGAFAERVSGRPWSWVCPWDWTATMWLEFFTTIRSQHFRTGKSPDLFVFSEDLFATDFDYYKAYVPEYLSKNLTKPMDEKLQLQTLIHSVEKRQVPFLTWKEKLSHKVRTQTLHFVTLLRRSAFLRTLMQKISPNLQRRVKSWLLGNRN